MKGETLAKCLLYILVITLGHVGAGGPANVDKNIFFEDFACCSVFAMTENRGKKQGFSTRSDAKKNATPKKTIQKTKFFKIKRFERATRAKKKQTCIFA